MKIKVSGRDVQVVTCGVEWAHLQMALGSRIFADWARSLDARFSISEIAVQAVDFRGRPAAETVMFARFRVKSADKPFAQIVELRGGTVVMMPIFKCENMLYTVLVKQPRIATGNYELAEFPAGMIDGGKFAGSAARELEEELGVIFAEDELVDMTSNSSGSSKEIYFSPGLLDEKARFYMAEREIDRDELAKLQGKATGLSEEGEHITLWVVPLDEVPACTRDGKTFIALYLYHNWQRRNA